MKRKIRYLLPALLFLLGAAILLYPPLSSFWNQRRQDTQIAAYRQTMAALDAADRAAQRAAAQAYNDGLPGLRFRSAGRGPIAYLPATADYPPLSC